MHKMPTLALAAIISICLSIPTVSARGGGGHGFSSYSSSGRSHSYTGDHYTRGYVRRDGSYVGGYHATNPNGTRNDNYSTRGNINPYTGKWGTKPRDEDLPGYYRGYGNRSYPSAAGTGFSSSPTVEVPLASAPGPDPVNSYASSARDRIAPTGLRHVCTHAEQVQARIARMNQYTVIPNCE
jgi:hypothetical protein